MKSFIIKTLIFTAVMLTILTVSLFCFPNPSAVNSLLGALTDKHQLLKQTPSPKIIFIGGSNLSFGLDSKKIQDRFNMPVINASIHASIGLKYYLNDLKPFIKEGDIIVVAPEYSQFYTDSFYGNIELVSILFDVFPEGRKYIDLGQWRRLLGFIPNYAATKIKYQDANPKNSNIGIYDRKSFNNYGDAYIHWTMPRERVKVAKPSASSDMVNEECILFLKGFNEYIKSKSAIMLMLPPVYQASSYVNQKLIIEKIKDRILVEKLPLIANPIAYKFPDSLFFNTNSHLIKTGVDLRTSLVIQDLSKIIHP